MHENINDKRRVGRIMGVELAQKYSFPLKMARPSRFDLLDSIGSIGIVPFPGFAIVVGECLAPVGSLGIGYIPFKHDDDGPSDLKILAKEEADPIIERTDHGRVQGAAIAVHPVQPPKPSLRVESAYGPAFIDLSVVEAAGDEVKIAHSPEARAVPHFTFEFSIFLAVG